MYQLNLKEDKNNTRLLFKVKKSESRVYKKKVLKDSFMSVQAGGQGQLLFKTQKIWKK